MFVDAVKAASHFSFPYVGLRHRADGRVYSIVGSFVLVNADGWIVTSAHIVEELLAMRRSSQDPAKSDDPGRVIHQSEIWALPDFDTVRPSLTVERVNHAADVAIGRLEPFDASRIGRFPVIRDCEAHPLEQGELVCRLGFPFHDVNATFDESRGGFCLAQGSFPVPRFALDGIVARFNRRSISESASGLFIETSTPGLRGQSGGPLLDVSGRLVGIQSHTAHLDLGFDAHYTDAAGTTVTERQFLNIGLASHVDEVRALLDAEGVDYGSG